jgi:hypothetical protein
LAHLKKQPWLMPGLFNASTVPSNEQQREQSQADQQKQRA